MFDSIQLPNASIAPANKRTQAIPQKHSQSQQSNTSAEFWENTPDWSEFEASFSMTQSVDRLDRLKKKHSMRFAVD